MTLWDWAIAAYARPSVADACLTMQDTFGQNVPLLLSAVWAAGEGRPLKLPAAVAVTHDWDAVVVGPLRALRRDLEAARPPIGDGAREALRVQVKAVELQAERVLLEALEALAAEVAQPQIDCLDALAGTASAWACARDLPSPDLSEIKHLAGLICCCGRA